jgi:hypothetical protein
MDDMPQTIPETDPLILNHAPIGASPGGILARMDARYVFLTGVVFMLYPLSRFLPAPGRIETARQSARGSSGRIGTKEPGKMATGSSFWESLGSEKLALPAIGRAM